MGLQKNEDTNRYYIGKVLLILYEYKLYEYKYIRVLYKKYITYVYKWNL